MKQTRLLKTLLAAVCLFVGTMSVWAETTTVGATDNTSGFWSQFSDYYTIQPNRSLRLSFTNHSDKEKTYHTWVGAITNDFDRVDPPASSETEGYYEYLIFRGDDGRWGSSSDAGAFTSNFTRSGDDDATVSEWLDGAHVELTISRSGSTVTMHADMYSAAGKYYWEQMVITAGDGTQNIRFFLTTEKGHLTDIAQNSVDASVYYFYQDYEDATDASSWTLPTNANETLSLENGSAPHGKYIKHATGDRSRNMYTVFSNTDFYQNTSYSLEFDCAFRAGNRTDNVQLTVNPWGATNNTFTPYLFNMLEDNSVSGESNLPFNINGAAEEVTFTAKTWYHVKLDITSTNVDYEISNANGSTLDNGTGSYSIPEGQNYKAKGITIQTGRNYGESWMDNIKIYGTGTEVITTSVSTSSVNLSAGTATIAVSTETNAVSSTIKQYYSTNPLLTNPVEISNGTVELASGTYYFYSVNTTTGSKSNSVQYAVESSETVSAPTVTISGNTITLTAQGTSDAGASVTSYYVANAPSADPATEGTLIALNTPTTVPQGYYYIYSVSEYGNVSAEPATAMSIARSQETFDFYNAADNGYTNLSDLGTGDSGDTRLSKLTNSAGTVAEFINGRIECSYLNANGDYWWVRNNGKGNSYNGLFVSSGKNDDLYVKVSAQDVVVFTWSNGGLTFSGTPNAYGDDIADGSTVVSGTKYMAKANGYIKVHGVAYTTIKSIVVYSDDADMVAAPVLSASANIVNVIGGGSADDNAVITSYYTTNGDDPTANSTAVENDQIVLGPGTTTVKVMSYNATTSTASSVESIEVVVPSSVPATITPTGYATFSSPYALDFSNAIDNLEGAYYVSAVAKGSVSMTKLNQAVPAETGLFLKGTAGETVTIPVVAFGTVIEGTNYLKPNTTSKEIAASTGDTYHYVFAYTTSDGSNPGFFNLASPVTLGAGKAYIETNEDIKPAVTQSAKVSILFSDPELTGITNAEAYETTNAKTGKIYNIAGQVVNESYKGIKIIDGKKVF